jgi:hypothetical protein
VTPATLSALSMLEALTQSGLQAADLRAKTLLSITSDAPTTILVYTALTGFAGRRLDVLVNGQLIDNAALEAAGQRLHHPRPALGFDVLEVGPLRDDMPSVSLSSALTEESATAIRWARRLRFVPDDDAAIAVSQFAVITAIRARPQGERYPYLVTGTEPAPDPGAPLDPIGIDLDEVRTMSLALRRSVHSGERDSLAEVVTPSARRTRLLEAGEYPIEEVLARLGARHNEDSDLWHCPRPERHTHGDATASMRVQRGRVRCYVCDPERVDSLRLTIDTLGCSVDEAADWILSSATRELAAAQV